MDAVPLRPIEEANVSRDALLPRSFVVPSAVRCRLSCLGGDGGSFDLLLLRTLAQNAVPF